LRTEVRLERITAMSTLRTLLFLALATTLSAQVTSENNEMLREGLKRYPEADTNKDGVLTLEEGRAFLQKMKKKPAGGAEADGRRVEA
jgi:hypothetical protein